MPRIPTKFLPGLQDANAGDGELGIVERAAGAGVAGAGEASFARPPDRVARDIWVKSRGAVSISFVAFDTDPAHFAFLRDAGGDVFPAQDAAALRQALQQIYEGKILAEAVDETEAASPAPAGSAGARPHGRAP